MKITAEAIFDGNMWEGYLKPRRTNRHADVIVFDRPAIGAEVEGKLAELVDPDAYEARRIAAREAFGGEAFLVVGRRTDPGRD